MGLGVSAWGRDRGSGSDRGELGEEVLTLFIRNLAKTYAQILDTPPTHCSRPGGPSIGSEPSFVSPTSADAGGRGSRWNGRREYKAQEVIEIDQDESDEDQEAKVQDQRAQAANPIPGSTSRLDPEAEGDRARGGTVEGKRKRTRLEEGEGGGGVDGGGVQSGV